MKRLCALAAVAVLLSSPQAAAAGGRAQAKFDSVMAALEDAPNAEQVFYGVKNLAGHGMDTAKIIADGGGYVAVSHTCSPCRVEVETSPDLRTWTYRATLDSSRPGAPSYYQASQPTIAAIDEGFVVADEVSDGHKSWLHFLAYPSQQALLSANPEDEFDAPHTLTSPNGGNEGTPSIFAASPHRLVVGFHYNNGVDREARGVLRNFSEWTTEPEAKVDNALTAAGGQGKHGDRDQITYQGVRLRVYEAQTVFSQGFADWRIYLYSPRLDVAEQVDVGVPGCASVGNPSFTLVGGVLVVAAFVFSQGCGHAGTLIYFRAVEP